jgi:hypothetical protein
MGSIYPPSHFKSKYAVDAVRFVDEIGQLLGEEQEVNPHHLPPWIIAGVW